VEAGTELLKQLLGQSLSRKGTCPNCDTATSLSRAKKEQIWPFIPSQFKSKSPIPRVELQVWECDYCDKSTTYLIYIERTDGEELTARARQVHPEQPPRGLSDKAPSEVRSLFREASIAENAGALRGAAGLYRATVEALCDQQGVPKAKLEVRIDALADKGVEADIVRDLHEARLTGNWSLHDGVTFSADEVADVAVLIEDAVEALYVEPARRLAMRKARAARRQPRTADQQPGSRDGGPA
jgi:ribosomal protein L37AE/L43A